jgi:hypothetical protein
MNQKVILQKLESDKRLRSRNTLASIHQININQNITEQKCYLNKLMNWIYLIVFII